MIGSTRIFVSEHALKKGPRLFKESRYRSKRVTKKLLKRFGGTHRMEPAIYQTPAGLIVHPALYQKLMMELDAQPGVRTTEVAPMRPASPHFLTEGLSDLTRRTWLE